MTYRLSRLAPGSFDVVLNGRIIASLVRNGQSEDAPWTAELLVDLPPEERPAPFTEAEHTFASLDEVRQWLGADTEDRSPH
jgi:hypothetical protein